jgi:tRNA pseudouridine32 synthase/23S rRNA pseudouridine746 synthase
VWQDYHCSARIRRKYPLPQGGTGDCCAPKLLQYAYLNGLKPVCMAEFWWGPSPKTEIRQHGQFYPACRGKCKPVLTWMLQGLDVDPNPEEQTGQPLLDIETVYEDDWLIVVNKPSGLLSVPGRVGSYSVATILHQHYPDSLLAHRLDMGTSGLMVAAKSRTVYASLQQQFTSHTIRKSYVALLDAMPAQERGTISLPLLCDPINRPRQVVDYERGKEAVTDYEVIGDRRVRLWPHTGRTHQLRMHCAHPDGLGCPIRGDELYGRPAERLFLHAERLELTHPVTGERMAFELPAPF